MSRLPLLVAALLVCVCGDAVASEAGVHRGTLSTAVADDFAHDRSREQVVLTHPDGTSEPVRAEGRGARRELRRAMGSRVVLDARRADGGTLVARSVEAVQTAAAPTRLPRVAILRVNFTDFRSAPTTAENARELWFDGTHSVRAFYEQQSFGRMHVGGDVHGLYELDIAGWGCDIDRIAGAADDAAADDGVDLAAYDHVAYVFPRNSSCQWAGLAHLPGTRMWINGEQGLRVLAHELGHNFGAAHAGALSCTQDGTAVSLSESCSRSEYGDPFDVMGMGATTLMSSWHRHEIGDYEGDTTAVRQIDATGTYVLDDADSEGGTDVLTIPRAGSPQHFALELRAPSAPFDAFAADDPVVNGVTVRLAGGGTWWNAATDLVDANPGGGFADAPVPPGGEVRDPARGIRIRVESVTAGEARVRVTLGEGDVAPPSAPTLTAEREGTTVRLNWTAATDDKAVVGYEVRRDGEELATTTDTSFDDQPPDIGSHRYEVVALDGAGNRTASNAVTVVIPDTTPPEVPQIVGAERESAYVTLRWTSSWDDVAFGHYNVWIDDVLAGEATSEEFVHALDRAGTFTYRVEAVDAAGNVAPSEEFQLDVDEVGPPAAPVVSGALDGGTVTLGWAAVTPAATVSEYRVFADGVQIGRTGGTSFRHTPGTDGTIVYRVASVGLTGRQAPSNPVAMVVGDPDGPGDPGDDDGEPVDTGGDPPVSTTPPPTGLPATVPFTGPFTPATQTFTPIVASGGAPAAQPPAVRRDLTRGILRVRLTPGLGELAPDRVTARVSSPAGAVRRVKITLDGKRIARCRAKPGKSAVTCAARLPASARTGGHRLRLVAKVRPRGVGRARSAALGLSLVAGRLA